MNTGLEVKGCLVPAQPAVRHRQREGQQMIAAKAKIDVCKLDQAMDGKPSACEQRERQRELSDDQPAPHPVPAGAYGAAAFLECLVQPSALRAHGRPPRATRAPAPGLIQRRHATQAPAIGGSFQGNQLCKRAHRDERGDADVGVMK
jgi:hypothetical protein